MIQFVRRYFVALVIPLLAALATSDAAAQTWVKLNAPPGNPDLSCVHFLSRTLGFVGGAIGTNGRLYRTADGGNTWVAVTLPGTPATINDIYFPNLTFGALVADGNYIAITTDGGATWTQRSVPVGQWATGGDINAVYFKDAVTGWVVGKAVGAGNGTRMAVTRDGGVTWNNVALQATPLNNLYDLDFLGTQRGIVVGTGTPPRKTITSNGGTTWALYDSVGTSAISLSMYGIDAVDGTAIAYAAGGQVVPGNPFYGEVRKSTDSGVTWQITPGMTNGMPGGNTLALNGVLAVHGSMVFASTRAKVYKTIDGGATWTSEVLPLLVGASNLKRFHRTTSDEVYLVGSSANVLRYQLAPNALFGSNQIAFAKACPGKTDNGQISISNDGAIPLTLDSVKIRQPVVAGVTFALLSKPNSVAPGIPGTVTIRVDISPTAPPGIYTGTLFLYTNDDNRTGQDTVKAILLTIPVTTKTLAYDQAVNRDAGALRVSPNFSTLLQMPRILSNTGECDVNVTVRLARGIDFRLNAPTLTKLSSGQDASISLTFEPQGPCERYDTVIVEHDGLNPVSPIRIPVVGIGTVQSFTTTPADTLNFAGVLLGFGTSQSLALQNNKLRRACLDTTTIVGFRITGPNASEFTTTFTLPGSGRLPLGPLAEVSVPITATPGAAGQRVAYAVVTTDINVNKPDTIVLVVNGLRPELTVINSEIRFGLTEIAGRRDSVLINFLQNLSNADAQVIDAQITGLHASDFVYMGPATSFDIASNTKKSLNVSFRPTGSGLRLANLELITTIGSGPITIPLIGSAIQASGGTQAGVVVFQSTSVNSCRDTVLRQFVYNSSTVPLRITDARIVDDPAGTPGDATAYTIVAPAIPPDLVIRPGDSASISLRFCPLSPKPYIARLKLANNSDISTFEAQLIGTGKASKVVDIDTVFFARTRVLTARDSVVRHFVQNLENGPITVDSVTITGADAQSFTYIGPSLPITLAAHSDTALTVRFRPLRRDRHFALMNIYTTQGKSLVVLGGPAIYPVLDIHPDKSTSLRVRLGDKRKLRINVVNVGDDTGRVEFATLTGSGAFTNVTTDPVPATLNILDTLRIFVDFAPEQFCDHEATVRIRGEGVRAIYSLADTNVAFAGIGVAPMVASRLPEINFGIRQGSGPYDSALVDFLGNLDFSASIANACLDSAIIDSMALVGPGAGSFAVTPPTLPAAVGPGDYMPLNVRFQPGSQGLKLADLLVYFDGHADSVRTIHLAGANALLPVVYGPFPGMFQLDFGNVRVGQFRDSSFTATNIGTLPITIDQLSSTLPSELAILSPSGSFQMLPNQPVTVSARFAPAALGQRLAYSVFTSGSLSDSSFRLVGNGVRDALRTAAPLVDFGTLPAGSQADTTAVLLNTPGALVPELSMLAPAAIDTAMIVAGAANFDLLFFPKLLGAGATDSVGLRFRSYGAPGPRTGMARVYYNRRTVGAATVIDSLDLPLAGRVAGEVRILAASLGPGISGSPGDTIRVPIILAGDVAGATLDSLHFTLGFRSTMLKPVAVAPAQAGVTGMMATTAAGKTGHATVGLKSSTQFAAGTLANVVFVAMLGDTVETTIGYDTIGAPGRIDVLFTTDSVRFGIAEFCDARGRLIRFDSALTFASKPNPTSRATHFAYTLPALVHARLVVYDAAGMEVARLVDAEQTPGYYLIGFDAARLAAGTYYCILDAGRFRRTVTLRILD